MGMYVKGYVQRVTMIVIAVAIVVASSLLSYCLFHEKLNNVGGQLNSYNAADYSIIYILNYGEALDNECLYPDTDIQFYQDAGMAHRLTVSSIMREGGISYNLKYLLPLSCLKPGEICITHNVAEAYKLNVGDTLFAEYSYSPEPVPVKVVSITQTDYDYRNPVIDNSIGVVFLGFDEEYFASMNSKYILFAEESKADELAIFPQIINEVINKSASIETVTTQGIGALAFEVLFSLVAVILTHILFFSKSNMPLYRCYLKGMDRFFMSAIPFGERLVFCLLPYTMVQCFSVSGIPENTLTKAFCMIPIIICGLYSIIMFVVDSLKLRRKGRLKWSS